MTTANYLSMAYSAAVDATANKVDIGVALRLQFSGSINGPLTLGYGCHFGLGQFWVPPTRD